MGEVYAPALLRRRPHLATANPEIPEGSEGALGGAVLTSPPRSGSFGQSGPTVVLRPIGAAELGGLSDVPMTSMAGIHPWPYHMGTW